MSREPVVTANGIFGAHVSLHVREYGIPAVVFRRETN